MDSRFEDILNECVERLRAGESAETCLIDYPDHAEALHPLLTVAANVFTLPRPCQSPATVDVGRQRMLAALEAKKLNIPVSRGWLARYAQRTRMFFHLPERHTSSPKKEKTNMRHVLQSALAVMLFFTVGIRAAFAASENSLPGDALYPMKLSWEQMQLTFTTNPQARQEYQAHLDATRRQEAQRIIELHRQAVVEFEGYVGDMDETRTSLTIMGIPVLLGAQTIVEGNLTVGAYVHVNAAANTQGQLNLLRIRVLPSPTSPVRFAGYVNKIDPAGHWIVVTKTKVQITPQTSIEGDLAKGTYVQIWATTRQGNLVATRIQVIEPSCKDTNCLATPTPATPPGWITPTLTTSTPYPTPTEEWITPTLPTDTPAPTDPATPTPPCSGGACDTPVPTDPATPTPPCSGSACITPTPFPLAWHWPTPTPVLVKTTPPPYRTPTPAPAFFSAAGNWPTPTFKPTLVKTTPPPYRTPTPMPGPVKTTPPPYRTPTPMPGPVKTTPPPYRTPTPTPGPVKTTPPPYRTPTPAPTFFPPGGQWPTSTPAP